MITGTVQSGSSGDGIESTFPGCGDVGYKFNEKKTKKTAPFWQHQTLLVCIVFITSSSRVVTPAISLAGGEF
jgi:hypothetical protein